MVTLSRVLWKTLCALGARHRVSEVKQGAKVEMSKHVCHIW